MRSFFLLLILFLFPLFSLAYNDTTTHPALTQEIAEFYNHYFKGNISLEEINLMKQGSTDEDAPPRYVNHFYDPVYNEAWKGELLKIPHTDKYFSPETVLSLTKKLWGYNNINPSYNWIKNQEEQAVYPRYFGNQTWQKAVYEYAFGDKKSAFLALGHVLHNLEDASVPEHTRNDTHANELKDGSPYENFSHEYTLAKNNNLDIAENLIKESKIPPVYNTPEEYFYSLAKYTNENFVSKDTINKYSKPEIKFVKLEDNNSIYTYYTTDKFDNFYPLYIFDREKKMFVFQYEDKQILPIYFNYLSRQSVLHGAGLLNLFFQEAEKTKQNPELAERPIENAKVGIISPFGEYARFKNLVKNTLQNFSGSLIAGFSNEQLISLGDELLKPVIQEMKANIISSQGGNIDNEANRVEEVKQPQIVIKTEISRNEPAVPEVAPAPEPAPIKPENAAVSLSPEPKEAQGGQTSFLVAKPLTDSFGLFAVSTGAGFGGGGEAVTANSQNNNPTLPSDTTPPQSPTITSPSSFNSVFTNSAINFQGTGEANSIIQAVYFSNSATTTATTSVSGLGNWSIALTFNQASTTIDFYAVDNAGNISGSTQIPLFVDSLAPEISLFNISECANSLSLEGCLIATTTLWLSWNSSSSDLDYYEFSYGSNVSTTTATSTILTLADFSSHSFSLRARDKTANWSSATTTSVEIATLPVVINEVGWMGTGPDYPEDEFIELYNRTSKTINLNRFVLYSSDLAPYINLSGSISPLGYYLLERTNDNTISSIPANQIYTGGLNNNPNAETLSLVYVSGNSTTTIDYVPTCGSNWCAGSLYRSMERVDSDIGGSVSANWLANNTLITNGKNAANSPINATPKSRNSADYLIASGQTNITSDTMLKKSKSPYLVNNNIQVFQGNAVLTIEPGVVIKFYNNAGFNISGNAKIVSQGTASEPIVFTSFYDDAFAGDTNGDAASILPSGGDWYGVKIDSTNTGSIFENTIFRYGTKYYAANGNTMANLSVENTSVSIASSTLEYSKIYGLKLLNSSSTVSNNIFRFNNQQNDPVGYNSAILINGGSPTIQSNTFSNNRRGIYLENAFLANISANSFNSNTNSAIYSYGAVANFSQNSGSGNSINAITLEGNLTQANSTGALKSNSLPYYLWGYNSPTVVASSTLTIEPNVVLKGSRITYASRLNVYGNLLVNGSSSSDVVFTSVYDDSMGGDTTNDGAASSPAKDNWTGISFYSGSSSNIRGATLSYANTALNYQSSPINLSNVRFSNNNLGVQADSGSMVQSVDGATIEFINNTATTSPANLW